MTKIWRCALSSWRAASVAVMAEDARAAGYHPHLHARGARKIAGKMGEVSNNKFKKKYKLVPVGRVRDLE